jgi:hypothetical protein
MASTSLRLPLPRQLSLTLEKAVDNVQEDELLSAPKVSFKAKTIFYHVTTLTAWDLHIKEEGLIPQSLKPWLHTDRYGIFLTPTQDMAMKYAEAMMHTLVDMGQGEVNIGSFVVLEASLPQERTMYADETYIQSDDTYGGYITQARIPPENIKYLGMLFPQKGMYEGWGWTTLLGENP